jgi:hypothetical protein
MERAINELQNVNTDRNLLNTRDATDNNLDTLQREPPAMLQQKAIRRRPTTSPSKMKPVKQKFSEFEKELEP